jgi:hypothetical protein
MNKVESHNFLIKSTCCFYATALKAVRQFKYGNIAEGRCHLDKASYLYRAIQALTPEPEDCNLTDMYLVAGESGIFPGDSVVAIFSLENTLEEYTYRWWYREQAGDPWTEMVGKTEYWINLTEADIVGPIGPGGATFPQFMMVEIVCQLNYCQSRTLVEEDVPGIAGSLPLTIFPATVTGTEINPPILPPL